MCAIAGTYMASNFVQISSQKKKTGVIAPKRFVQRVKKENELFRGYMHQVSLSFRCYTELCFLRPCEIVMSFAYMLFKNCLTK